MKRFLITYTYGLEPGTEAAWHRTVQEFIAALNSDPELMGRITYHCMKMRDGAKYFHLAEVADDEATKTLQSRDFFKHYTEETKRVAGGEVVVTPLETIAG